MVQDGNQMQPDTPAYGRPEAQTQPTAPEEPARLGPVQRFFGVLFSPTETFEDVNRKPNWIVPILIIMVTVLASTLFFNWKVHPNWDAIIRKQITESIEKRGAQMPSEDQIQRQVDFGKTIAKFSPAIAAVAAPILYLVLAGIF
ncbi:MAG TPA: hypothetical protein VNN73_13695, partial [Blastocatellia bacterium]|nr:hypothetical protein [Blastocatellia bacterium]